MVEEEESLADNDDDAPTFCNMQVVRQTLPLPDDGNCVNLAIEGGGMHGCITEGMVATLHHLGWSDAFDVMYG